MNKLYKLSFVLLIVLLIHGCSKDDDVVLPSIKPEAKGTIVDARDGYTYHWVRYAGLDWTVENSHYNTGDNLCAGYSLNAALSSFGDPDPELVSKYGYLYTYAGAMEAAPSGWRIPTDADWQKLEKALGLSDVQANDSDWRGSSIATLMIQDSTGTGVHLLYGGYFTATSSSYSSKFRLLSAYGFYWTATTNPNISGNMAYYRKIVYNSGKMFRSCSDQANMYSVRFVRDSSDK